MITDRDIILRTVACDKDAKNTPASEIMTCNVCTCNENDDVHTAENKMAQNQIRRIPVVDNDKVIGILTLGDLAHYNEETGEDHFCNTVEDICGCGSHVSAPVLCNSSKTIKSALLLANIFLNTLSFVSLSFSAKL